MITIGGDQHALLCGRYRLGRQALSLQVALNNAIRHRVELFQRMNIGATTTRITVDLLLDELCHGRLAVARDPGTFALCNGDHFAADH